MDAGFLKEKFAAALTYERYVESGTEEQRRRWDQVHQAASLTEGQKTLLSSFVRSMKILVVSGIWCGDCVQQCPLIARIAEANPAKISLGFLDRDKNRELSEFFHINGGERVPVVVFLSEDFEFCGSYGERTVSRYRAIAHRQLGASCATGIVVPDKDEMHATLADWLTEIERIQLMLRLSPRLRQKYGD